LPGPHHRPFTPQLLCFLGCLKGRGARIDLPARDFHQAAEGTSMRFHRPCSLFLGIGLTGVFSTVAAGPGRAQSPAEGAARQTQPAANSHEPLAATLSLAKAANFLDTVTLDWTREQKCMSCHTGYPYSLARASIGDQDVPAARTIRKYLEDRVAE